jgi:hypothetical protein
MAGGQPSLTRRLGSCGNWGNWGNWGSADTGRHAPRCPLFRADVEPTCASGHRIRTWAQHRRHGTQDGRFPAVRTGPRRDRKPRYPHDRWTGAGRYLLVVLTEAMDGRDYEVTVRDRCLAPDLRTQGKVKQVSKQDEKDSRDSSPE